MRDITSIDEYFPNRETVSEVVNDWDFEWSDELINWDDDLGNALEDGNITQEEVDALAAEKKENFIDAIVCGSKLTDEEAIPALLEEGVFYYSWDHDGGKIPYFKAIGTYWERKHYIEHGIDYELLTWSLDDVAHHYLPGSEEKIAELEEDFDFTTSLSAVFQEFCRLKDERAAAALSYGIFMVIYIIDEIHRLA